MSAGARRRLALPPVGPTAQVACVAVALLLGFVGFTLAYDRAGIAVSVLERGAMSVRLIVGQFPGDLDRHDLPIPLWIARYALPLLTLWTTAALAWRQVRNPFRLWRIAAQGGHVVVAGDARDDGGLAARVAQAELARGRRVLVWSDDADARWVAELVEAGAAQAGGYDRLALGKARAALLLAADDTANAAAARELVDAAHGTRAPGDPLDVIVRIDDLDLRRSVERRFEGAAKIGGGDARVRFASLPDLAARELFVEAPLDRFRREGQAARLVLLLGFSPAIERYVRRLLAGSHFRDGVRPRFVVVANDPKAEEAGFRARNPGIDVLSPVAFEKGPIDRPSAGAELLRDLVERHGEPVAIVIDTGDDARTAALGLGIADVYAVGERVAPPIHVRLSAAREGLTGASLRAFGTMERFADPELLLQEDHDALARSIHDFYLQGRFDEGETLGARASLHEWEDLPESFRDDNRLVADCYALKLRDIGARVVVGAGVPMKIEPDELEELSRAEHDRWMGSKLADGWQFAPARDDAKRLHPDIVPYDDLSERIKDLDREQVRAITRLLSHAGRRALRTLVVGVAPAAVADPEAAAAALVAVLREHYPDRVPLFAGDPAGPARPLLAAAARRGAPVLLTLAGNPDRWIAGLAGPARHEAVALVRDADSWVATDDPAAWLDAAATLTVGAEDARAIRIGADGAIEAAPWMR